MEKDNELWDAISQEEVLGRCGVTLDPCSFWAELHFSFSLTHPTRTEKVDEG